MVVCKFFLQNRCAYGDSCKNEHPGHNTQNQNRFAPLQNGANNGQRGRAGAFGGGQTRREEFQVTADNIRIDVTTGDGGERPIWPLSAYGPGVNAPRQLLEGPIEISQEEMRVQYYLKQATGQTQEYINQEQSLLQQVDSQIQNILRNPEEAKKYVVDGQDVHPNRIDEVVVSKTPFARSAPSQQQSGGFAQPSGGFGGSPAPAAGGFGQPSGLGTQRPAFGAASTPASGFGQPTALGGGSAFGQPSGLGGGGGGFGQPSTLGQSTPFGGAQRPSPFGQPPQPAASTSAFGQPSQPGSGQTPFGGATRPAAFGAPSQPAQPAFGAPSQPGQSAFGQPAQNAQPAFGAPSTRPAFGAPSQPAQPAFGARSQPNGFGGGQQPQQTGGFGGASALGARPSPFAAAPQPQNQPPASNPFAAARTTQTPSPFGQPAQTPPANPFASQTAAGPAPSTNGNSTFGRPTGFGASTTPQLSGKAAPPGGIWGLNWNATSFHGKRIVKDDKGHPCTQSRVDGKERLDRVWFPDGPIHQENVANPDALHDREAPAEVYEGELGEVLKGLYQFVLAEGTFKDGIMPEIPPKLEWNDWDL